MLNIRLKRHEHLPALLMLWPAHPKVQEIATACQALSNTLSESHEPLFVLIDLSHNHTLPIAETIHYALQGAYTHPKLLACLVIGGNNQARIIGNIIQRLSRHYKFLWFKDEEAAFHFIDSQSAKPSV